METTEEMKFIHAMVKKDYCIIKLDARRFEIAKKYISSLQAYDPHNVYKIDKRESLIIKEKRQITRLTKELFDLEDKFVKNRGINNRQKIIRIFDDIKRGYYSGESKLNELRNLIN